MRKQQLLFGNYKIAFLAAGLFIGIWFNSCTKGGQINHFDDGRKHYRILVTWSGNPANLVNHASGDTLDVAQEIAVDFEVFKGDTTACCVGDKRIIDSTGWYNGSTSFDNEDLLSNDSLWAITDGEEGVNTLRINASNDEILDYSDYYNSGPKKKVVPPSVSVRIRVFPPESQTILLDTTIHMVPALPPCTENCSFHYALHLK